MNVARPVLGIAEGEAAREVLAAYDPAELAALCTAVNPHHLMWHVTAVITAWPGQPAVQDFADKLIHDPKPITSGIPDTIPVAILRAFCGRTDEPSRRILDKTLDLLKHIEPELREVLAFELARSSLAANDLREVIGGVEERTRHRGSPQRLHRAHPSGQTSPASPRQRSRRRQANRRNGMATQGDQGRPMRALPEMECRDVQGCPG